MRSHGCGVVLCLVVVAVIVFVGRLKMVLRRVAAGRDIRQAIPLSGSFFGSTADHEETVSVTVRQFSDTELPADDAR